VEHDGEVLILSLPQFIETTDYSVDRCLRHGRRLTLPPLVTELVNVTIAARNVAAAGGLQQDGIDGDGHVAPT
jgi:hypothetical protein